jgi:hypothetical protein
MLNKLSLITISIIFYQSVFAQIVDVPDGVNYKQTDATINQQAVDIIKKELSNPSYALFEKLLYCGPNLWERYMLIPEVGSIKKGNIIFKVPEGNTHIEKSGKLIQSQEDFIILWDQVVEDFKGSEFTIRKLSHDELKDFWSIIFYDIEEPIFLIKNKSYKVILDFAGDDLKLSLIETLKS